MTSCADIDDLLPAVALGIATPEEQREVEEHVRTCDRHPQLAELRQVGESLAMTVGPEQPSDHVKHRLMARVYRDLEDRVRRPWWQTSWAALVAAVLAVVAIGLGARDYVVSSQLASAPQQWQLQPAVTGIRTSGVLVYMPRQGLATLTLQQLPPLASNNVYEVWLIKNGQPQPAGLLKPSAGGTGSVVITGQPSSYDVVAVTEEPGPNGSAQPTTKPFISAPLK